MENVKTRTVTQSGTITIPPELRHALGLMPGVAVDLVPSGGCLVVRPHYDRRCDVCDTDKNVLNIGGISLCYSCCVKLKSKFDCKS